MSNCCTFLQIPPLQEQLKARGFNLDGLSLEWLVEYLVRHEIGDEYPILIIEWLPGMDAVLYYVIWYIYIYY